PARAQTSLTLGEAMRRTQEGTSAARALAAGLEEADARIRQARSGIWPRIDVSETEQRGNQPGFVFGYLLAQRQFTAANFAIPALNHPDPVTNTRTALAIEQRVFDGGLTRLEVAAANLEREGASAARDTARQDLGLRAAQAFVRVLQLESMV